MSKDWVRMWCMAFEDLGLVKVNVGYMRGQIHYYMSELLKLLWVHVRTHLLVSMPKNWRPSLSHWIDYLWRPSASHGQGWWLRTKFDQVYLIFPRLLIHTLTLQATGVSGNSRSRPFPRMKASDSLSRIMGMDFFIPFPFPNFGNAFFSFPSRSRIMGMGFFHSLPVPELWEWIFFIPFPFPNCGNGFF